MNSLLADRQVLSQGTSALHVGRGWTIVSLLCPQTKLGAKQGEALRKYVQI